MSPGSLHTHVEPAWAENATRKEKAAVVWHKSVDYVKSHFVSVSAKVCVLSLRRVLCGQAPPSFGLIKCTTSFKQSSGVMARSDLQLRDTLSDLASQVFLIVTGGFLLSVQTCTA